MQTYLLCFLPRLPRHGLTVPFESAKSVQEEGNSFVQLTRPSSSCNHQRDPPKSLSGLDGSRTQQIASVSGSGLQTGWFRTRTARSKFSLHLVSSAKRKSDSLMNQKKSTLSKQITPSCRFDISLMLLKWRMSLSKKGIARFGCVEDMLFSL